MDRADPILKLDYEPSGRPARMRWSALILPLLAISWNLLMIALVWQHLAELRRRILFWSMTRSVRPGFGPAPGLAEYLAINQRTDHLWVAALLLTCFGIMVVLAAYWIRRTWKARGQSALLPMQYWIVRGITLVTIFALAWWQQAILIDFDKTIRIFIDLGPMSPFTWAALLAGPGLVAIVLHLVWYTRDEQPTEPS